jgi:APA family basic amino acid/polyamine antiporter
MSQKMELKRELNLLQVVLIGVGIIFGAGIYALVGVMAGLAGNGAYISVIIAGLICLFTGLSYAFLSKNFPSNSSEYIYILKTFNSEILAKFSGYLMIISGIISVPLVAIAFGMYFSALFKVNAVIPAAIILITISTIILLMGIKESALATIIGTLIEVFGVLIIIILGMPYVGNLNFFEFKSINGIFSAAVVAVFAFLGFESITRLSEETKNPEKNIPKGIVLSILISLIVYNLTVVSSLAVLGAENLAKSKAPLADVANKIFGGNDLLMLSVIALFSTANTVLGMLLVTSRQIHGMSEMNAFIYSKIFGKIYKSVPANAIILSSLLSLIFLFIPDLRILVDLSVIPILIVFFLVNISAMIQNFKTEKKKFYILSSLLGALSCLFLVFHEISMLI